MKEGECWLLLPKMCRSNHLLNIRKVSNGKRNKNFLTFPACFSIPIIFSNLNSNCSNLLDLRNLQDQVKKAFCYQKLFWPFNVWTNCSSDLKKFYQSLEQFFQTVKGQNNFWQWNAFLTWSWRFLISNKLEQFKFKLEKIIGI